MAIITQYSNLSSINVSVGATVLKGEAIGKAASDMDGTGKIDLLLMQGKQNVDPEP